jgi:hypothetical protein
MPLLMAAKGAHRESGFSQVNVFGQGLIAESIAGAEKQDGISALALASLELWPRRMTPAVSAKM